MRNGLKRFLPALLALTLAGCSQRILTPAKFPRPSRPALREIEVADCVRLKGYRKLVCLPTDSPWSFIKTTALLLNDEDLKNYIQALESAPFWDEKQTP